MTIPILRPEAVTPDWLTAVLAQGGVEARVAGFTAKPVGTGQIGQSVKFTLDYARAGTNAPASLVGKFPAPGEESRGTGVALGNYIREANFYNHLAPTALIATPKCYFADVDPETSEFVLMMEDLAPAEQGDQLRGCTLHQARLALYEAANLHASHWNDAPSRTSLGSAARAPRPRSARPIRTRSPRCGRCSVPAMSAASQPMRAASAMR